MVQNPLLVSQAPMLENPNQTLALVERLQRNLKRNPVLIITAPLLTQPPWNLHYIISYHTISYCSRIVYFLHIALYCKEAASPSPQLRVGAASGVAAAPWLREAASQQYRIPMHSIYIYHTYICMYVSMYVCMYDNMCIYTDTYIDPCDSNDSTAFQIVLERLLQCGT